MSSEIDVLTVGESMVALRTRSMLRMASSLDISVAGAESNVAIGLARLGHRVRWVGRVGADELGAAVLRTLRAEGVVVDDRALTPGQQTGLIFFDRAPGGRTRVEYHRARSATASLAPEDMAPAWEERPHLLHLTGITPALGPGPCRTVTHALDSARSRRGTVVCLDVNYRTKLWSAAQASECLRPMMPSVHVLVASEDELPLVSGADQEEDQVAELFTAGVREVVVKRGSEGASVFTSSGRTDRDAVPVALVDTVGAGDAFTAGYLSAVLDGLDVVHRLERAVTMGAAAVAVSGDWEGLPTKRDLMLVTASSQEAYR